MPIHIKLSSTLRHHLPDYDPFKDYMIEHIPGEDLTALIERLGLTGQEIKILMINGRSSRPDSIIKDGDRVALFPTVGGG